MIRPCRADETGAILAIVNAAAQAYRGVIPDDCWHEPYMAAAYLEAEIARGVSFVGYEVDGVLAGIMGFQSVRNVDLIRHAYIAPAHQGRGIGGALMAHIRERTSRQILVGAWADATWALGFYRRHGFAQVSHADAARLLRTYWTISDRQVETSVVLASPALTSDRITHLIAAA